ncbi:hypothetical protein G5V57_15990 [Nordella sp. HKS 07]|uniref:hypothetical protein n=1 Tax=Nordella sp. HKS 07 TaxID=2712222 RepID=UPI0013E0F055|nr:hypothetical protein [Nordella sp. HKS 07]QIG49088.1 hypothetical protein G5V57_15990 [Nordella sp. HKS 07]
MGNYRKVKGGATMPDGKWSRVTQLQRVVGVQYRKRNAVEFAKLVFAAARKGNPYGLLAEREPDNPHDRNAVKIIGWGIAKSTFLGRKVPVNLHLGYLDADTSGRLAEKFPDIPLAVEFYSLYEGRLGYIDICFFLAAPPALSAVSARSRRLIESISDELLILVYASRADGRMGRFEHDVLGKYAELRAQDLDMPLDQEEIAEMRRWCKSQSPESEDAEAAIDRLSERPEADPNGLWEMIEIVLTVDGKVTKTEKAAAIELAKFMEQSFGRNPLR